MSLAVSGDRMVDYLLYGVPGERTRNYFQKELEEFQSYVPNYNNWAIQSFQNRYNDVYSQEAINNAQWCLRKSASQFRDDIIHQVYIDKYRPNLITQQYIMACPEVWNMRMKGLSNDFNLEYVDTEPHIKDVHWRDDYINVMDGYLDEEKSVFNFYYREEDNPLSMEDRDIILRNWDVVREILNNGDDPTII